MEETMEHGYEWITSANDIWVCLNIHIVINQSKVSYVNIFIAPIET